MPKDWMKSAVKRPGALRQKLNAKPGKPIPPAKLKKAAKAPGLEGQEARLAEIFRKYKP